MSKTSRSRSSRRRRRLIWLGVVLVLVLAFPAYLAVVPTRFVEAALVLIDVAARDASSTLKARTAAPVRRTRTIQAGNRAYIMDIYRPGVSSTPRAALLLITGFSPQGKDDTRTVAFATSLARARFLVVVPDIRNLRRMQVLPSDVDQVAATISHIANNAESLGVSRIGIAAVSYGVGPALLASVRPAIRDKVNFILGIGGYYDMKASVRYFTTGHYREPGDTKAAGWRYRKPDTRLKWLFLYNNASFVESEKDRWALRALARVKFKNEKAPAQSFLAGLGARAQSLYQLSANGDPDKVTALMSRLPAGIRETAAAMDLSNKDLSALKARLILVHGRDDRMIPSGESVKLAAAVAPGLAEVYLVDNLFHIDLGPMTVSDGATLWWAMLKVLRARDGD